MVVPHGMEQVQHVIVIYMENWSFDGQFGLFPGANVPAERRLPPRTTPTIGDRLSAHGVSWAWYSGGWNDAVAGHPDPLFNSTTSLSPTSPAMHPAHPGGSTSRMRWTSFAT